MYNANNVSNDDKYCNTNNENKYNNIHTDSDHNNGTILIVHR